MDTATVARELEQCYKSELLGSFPYADCRKLLEGSGDRFEGLIPDLDMYFYGIASPCGAATRLIQRGPELWLQARAQLQQSFFERHPEHADLEVLITPDNTPSLHQQMQAHERLRKKVLHLIAMLLEKADPEP